MSGFFLCYRRDDSAGFAGRLADALEARFGADAVFRDVDDIRPGEDFTRAIHAQLERVDAVLVLIGPRWLATDAAGLRRIDAAGDVVREEIAAALTTGKPVIPLLVGGAGMPTEAALPPALAMFARRQAVALSDANWRGDVARLVAALRRLQRGPGARGRRRFQVAIAATVALVLIGAVALHFLGAHEPRPAAAVTGHWRAQVRYDWGDRHDEVFAFEWRGDRLHGTASYLGGPLTIESPRLEGDWLRFTTRSQEMLGDSPWKEVRHEYTGRVQPTQIEFRLETTGGYSVHPPVEFTAERPAR